MLIGAEAVVRQPTKESKVAVTDQALSGLCVFFDLNNHPKLLIVGDG